MDPAEGDLQVKVNEARLFGEGVVVVGYGVDEELGALEADEVDVLAQEVELLEQLEGLLAALLILGGRVLPALVV